MHELNFQSVGWKGPLKGVGTFEPETCLKRRKKKKKKSDTNKSTCFERKRRPLDRGEKKGNRIDSPQGEIEKAPRWGGEEVINVMIKKGRERTTSDMCK